MSWSARWWLLCSTRRTPASPGRRASGEPCPNDLHVAGRFGLHTGEAERRGTDYGGSAIALAVQIRGQAEGGQIILSSVTAKLVAGHLPAGCELVDLGPHRVRGRGEPERIHAIKAADINAPLAATACPYRGLLPFEPEDRDYFFGREQLARELIGRLKPGRLVAVVGASGSGKSSLLRAGVMLRYAPARSTLSDTHPSSGRAAHPSWTSRTIRPASWSSINSRSCSPSARTPRADRHSSKRCSRSVPSGTRAPDDARRRGDRPPSTDLEQRSRHIRRTSNVVFTRIVRPRVAPLRCTLSAPLVLCPRSRALLTRGLVMGRGPIGGRQSADDEPAQLWRSGERADHAGPGPPARQHAVAKRRPARRIRLVHDDRRHRSRPQWRLEGNRQLVQPARPGPRVRLPGARGRDQ
jgi:hypothetical protein